MQMYHEALAVRGVVQVGLKDRGTCSYQFESGSSSQPLFIMLPSQNGMPNVLSLIWDLHH